MPRRPQSIATPFIQNQRPFYMSLFLAVVSAIGTSFDLIGGFHWIALGNSLGILACLALAFGTRTFGWSSSRRWFTALILFWIGASLILALTGGVQSPFWGIYMVSLFFTSGCISSLELKWAIAFSAVNTLAWIGIYVVVGPIHAQVLTTWLAISQNCMIVIGSYGIIYNFISIQEVYIDERNVQLRRLEEVQTTQAHSEKMAGMGSLMASTAHEMAQPVQVILTASSLVRRLLEKDTATKERLETMIGQILEATQRISRLLTQLKDFSRKEPYEMQKLDMREVLDGVSRMVEYDPRWRGLTPKIETPSSPLWVRGDLLRLEQVIVNLMNNACDAARGANRPSVRVTASRTGDWVRVAVKNNGDAIPTNLQPRIFEAYFTTKKRGQGTGLGLTICDQLVTQQKGRILFSSAEDDTIFVVDLPAMVQEQAPEVFSGPRAVSSG